MLVLFGLVLLFALGVAIEPTRWWRRKRRCSDLKHSTPDAVFLPTLSVDIDSSDLTICKGQVDAMPYYLVLDTETFDAIPNDEVPDSYLSLDPIAVSWQVLDVLPRRAI